jgi:hypothetical protein
VSANNWDVCPACKKKAEAARLKAMEDAAKAYGKVPPDEWKELSDRASKPVDLDETMREDYELGVDSKGVFGVSYSASCQECAFVFRFKHEQKTDAP